MPDDTQQVFQNPTANIQTQDKQKLSKLAVPGNCYTTRLLLNQIIIPNT